MVGADGIRSWIRRAIGIDLETRSVGMGIWRVFGPRPGRASRAPTCTTAGPATSPDTARPARTRSYAYLVEDAQDRSSLTPQAAAGDDARLPRPTTARGTTSASQPDRPGEVNYTWFETHVLSAPWNRGRVVLIGDAAHTCPPTLAQGAAQALEDAAVLAELLLAAQTLDDGLWKAVHRPPLRARPDRGRGLGAAGAVAARPRARRRARA